MIQKNTGTKVKKVDDRLSVTFVVYLGAAAKAAEGEELYIVGSVPKLGEWNPARGLPLKLTKSGVWRKSLKLEPNTVVDFKIIKGTSWDGVEKGVYGEELVNHSFVLTEKTLAPVIVTQWAGE